MAERLNRIVIIDKNIRGDLKRCKICDVNFTAFDNCIICQLIIEKEEELGRKLTKEEFDELLSGF